MKAIHLINKLNQLPEVSNKLLYPKDKQNNNYIIHVETCISNDTHINSTSERWNNNFKDNLKYSKMYIASIN